MQPVLPGDLHGDAVGGIVLQEPLVALQRVLAGALGLEELRGLGVMAELGVEVVELLDTDALAARFPSVGRQDVALACYAPEDGWIEAEVERLEFEGEYQEAEVQRRRTRTMYLRALDLSRFDS